MLIGIFIDIEMTLVSLVIITIISLNHLASIQYNKLYDNLCCFLSLLLAELTFYFL